MCDTVVALANSTSDGAVIFAKNSDRQPNEPLLHIRIPSQTFPEKSTLRCTYIDIEQVERTNEIFIAKPSWMWGCEMGTNEHGLTIGNEAVFTKEKVNKTGLLGMDLVRLALERCANPKEAIDCITSLLEKYGQGGNCGYEKPFTYHNAFLICDKNDAWVLETAGQYWAAEKVKDIRAISNRLSIGEHYDLAHPKLISHAIEKGWHKKGKKFHFANSYQDFLFTKFSGSKKRSQCALEILKAEKGNITENTMMNILRSHHDNSKQTHIDKFSVKSICMHAGFFYGDQTTGSYVITLKQEKPMVGWITGSSAACISIFKPTYFSSKLENHFFEAEGDALKYWLERERIHRLLMKAPNQMTIDYHIERKSIEKTIQQLANKGNFSEGWQLERDFVRKYIRLLIPYENRSIKGGIYYKYYWKKQNKQLQKNHEVFFQKSAALSK